MKKYAIVVGANGQDGSYLVGHLLATSEYDKVVGAVRRSSQPRLQNLFSVLNTPNFQLVEGDVTDQLCMHRLLTQAAEQCDILEVYNLAAQSHVGTSFHEPSHTTAVTYGGCLNILECIRSSPELSRKTKFYQASSSEMFGKAYSFHSGYSSVRMESTFRERDETDGEAFQDECTPMLPRSPYAIAKLAAHHAVRLYRESYGIFACSGILFNHESPRRGLNFVTRKITNHLAKLYRGETTEKLCLGNLSAKRDWGFAGDYVLAMHMMLQKPQAGDFVVATGKTYTVETFLLKCLEFIGVSAERAQAYYKIDPALIRPSEVEYLRGDASRARAVLGWRPKVGIDGLVEQMMKADIDNV